MSTIGEVRGTGRATTGVRFVHTADWQIGMTRRYLPAEAQGRFTAARTEVVRRIGALAAEQQADFVLVAGDVFEHSQLTPQTVRRALEALREVPVPVYLLPGNHDHLGPMSIWSSPVLRDELPEHVHVLDSVGVHAVVLDGGREVEPSSTGRRVELVAAPWAGKHPTQDPVAAALATLPPGPAPEGTVRVLVGHGAVDVLDPDGHAKAPIQVAALREALDEGRIHYVALGDRHSRTQVGGDPAIWFSGAPEPTDWREQAPGDALVVRISPLADGGAGAGAFAGAGRQAQVEVEPHSVARWRYVALDERVDSDADLDALDRRLTALPDKECTIVRLGLSGTLGLAQHARLEEILERHLDLLAALHRPAQHSDVVLVADDDLSELELRGFLAGAVDVLRSESVTDDAETGADDTGTGADDAGMLSDEPFQPGRPDDDESARDALALLYRLTRGGAR
ncbi:metallophosphoesterase family protein [Ornithinimicrobium sp. Y1847]|uniref:metallophosphoesterase family protein n=1 Tax=Ornithinimicrobium sp. Y1847 TaxID=3405419 RepID=UPI003B67D564